MKINNKLGLLVAIMLLGSYTISDSAYSQPATEGVILRASDYSDEITTIKANKETLESAKEDMQNKNYESALTYLNAYISGKPKKYEGYKLRGECYYALRQYELARQDFQTAVEIKTNDDKFITGTKVVSAIVLGADKEGQTQNPELGILYGELMYAQKALNDPAYEDSYKKAFEYNSHQYLPQPKANDILKINCPQKYGKIFNPQGNDAYIMDVINDIESGDFHEAAYKLPQLSSNMPKYYLTYYLTGVVMAGLEQDSDAIAAFEKAIKLNPNDFESLASLGQIYYSEAEKSFSKEKANKSIEYFNKAIKLNPNLSTYNYYIGLNNLLTGDNDAAISAFDKAISQRSNDYNSMYYKAIAQQIKGDYNSVIDGTTKLLNRHVSNYNSVLYLQALAYAKSGNNDSALENIEKIFSGMNDIYNADIKTTSAKEATLPNYLHLLKGQILAQKGEDSSEEFEKAFENPVIKSLASKSGFDFVISTPDMENQLDYIRTAFDNFGKVIPVTDGYRVTSSLIPQSGEFVRPEFATKQLSSENSVDLTPSIAQKIISQNYSNNATAPQTTPEQDIVTPSVSQVLANPDMTLPKIAETNEENKVDKAEEKTDGVRIGFGIPFATPVPAAKGEPMVFTAADAVKVTEPAAKVTEPAVKVSETANKTVEAAAKSVNETVQSAEKVAESAPVVVAAPVQKDSDDFNIKYKPETVETVAKKVDTEAVKIAEEVKTAQSSINSEETVLPEKIATILATEPVKVTAKEQKPTDNFNITYPDNTAPVVDTVISEAKDIELQQKDVTTTVATTIKEVEDYTISYPKEVKEKVAEDIAGKQDVLERLNDNHKDLELAKENAQESLAKTISRAENEIAPNTVESVEQVAQAPTVILPDLSESVEHISKPATKIAEKFADVDLNAYNVQNTAPVINPGDEVIVFDPASAPIFSQGQRLAAAQKTDLNTTPKITDDFSQIHKAVKETVETVQSAAEETKTTVETAAEEIKTSPEKVAQKVEEEYVAPELVLPEDVKIERVAAQTKTETPAITPKLRQAAEKTEEVVTDITAAQTENVLTEGENTVAKAEEEQEWLKDFLNKAEETVDDTEKKVKKEKIKKEKNVQEFLTDSDEKLIQKAKKLEEKQAKLKAKEEARLAKQALKQEKAAKLAEEKLAKQALKEEKAAKAAEEKALLKAQKAQQKAEKLEEKARLKAAKASEKARLKAEKQALKEAQKKAEQEVRGAVTVIDGDKLIKVKNKEKKKLNRWWKKNTDTNIKKTKSEVTEAKKFSFKNLFSKKNSDTKSRHLWFRKDK